MKSIKFPPIGQVKKDVFKALNVHKGNIIDYRDTKYLAFPATTPSPVAVDAFNEFVYQNPNNIGLHTMGCSESGFAGTQNMEREAVEMIGTLFGLKSTEVDGYMTTGGTESNLMGMWVLRNVFDNDVTVLKSDLNHYSIDKGLNILGIKDSVNVPLNDNFEMDSIEFHKVLLQQIKKGKKKFAVMTNLGATVSGAVDPILELDSAIQTLKNKYDFECYIHIDACHGGFVYPFVNEDEEPIGFNIPSVMTIAVDAHKTGMLPYSCGVFLTRKNTMHTLETKAEYTGCKFDYTMTGSRSGAMAAALWATIHNIGFDGYQMINQANLSLKKHFIRELVNSDIACTYFTNPNINTVAVEFSSFPNKKLPRAIEKKYGLHSTQIENNGIFHVLYKLVIMSHTTIENLNQFISDVINAHNMITGSCSLSQNRNHDLSSPEPMQPALRLIKKE